jgi:anti-sigma factor RsiW
MDCREVREIADSFVAGELLTETNHALLGHLASCPACRADVDGRRRLRQGLQQAFERSASLAIRPEFAGELRDVLRQSHGPARAGRTFAALRWWAIAYRARAVDPWLLAAAGDHRNCALHFNLDERPISLADAARRFGPSFAVFEQLPAEVSIGGDTARVLERHACVYAGIRFAHVVFRYRGVRVSLVAARAAQPHPAGAGLVSSRVDGLGVVTFHAGDHTVSLVGDLPAADLAALASAISGDLASRLQQV